ncbi:MAG: MFS transporter [Ardenticatenaceae bacterium]|nr:MFS transporter [Anaerolineales bacterium]MCB8938548.1 MFS transporter [Ardenticatenaceae bacterium]MCB8973681.1 MFS transporter [Ardenticatenaceae bacterium]
MSTPTPTHSFWQKVRELPRNIWVLTLASFLTDVSTEMIVHLIPLFLANVLGVRTVTIGLIEGVAETTASLLKVWSGRFSDWLGRRKWLTVSGYALSTVAKPFLVLANSWPAVLGVRFFERMGKGIRTAPRDALVADSITPEKRGMAFGLHRAGDSAGAMLGLLIGLTAVWLLQGQALTLSRSTFHTLVWLSVVPAVLAVIALGVGIQEVKAKDGAKQAAAATLSSLPPAFKRFLLIVALFTLGNSSDAFLILRAQERGLSLLGVMGMLVAFNGVYAAVSGPAGSLSDKIGRKRILTAGWLLYALIYLGLGLAQTGWQVVGLMIVYGIYYGLAEGAAKSYVADLVPQAQRGTAYGWYNGAVGLAALPASLLAGLLWQGIGSWQGFGVQAPFLFGAVLSLVAVGLFLVWLPQGVREA